VDQAVASLVQGQDHFGTVIEDVCAVEPSEFSHLVRKISTVEPDSRLLHDLKESIARDHAFVGQEDSGTGSTGCLKESSRLLDPIAERASHNPGRRLGPYFFQPTGSELDADVR
jgi:hypothetical protein